MEILIIGISLLVGLSFLAGGRDIFDPVFLCCAFFLVSAFCACMNIDLWRVDFSAKTISLILLSLLSMILFGFFGQHIRVHTRRIHAAARPLEIINVGGGKIAVVILLGAVATVIYFREVQLIAQANGYAAGSGIGRLIGIYRNASRFSGDMDNYVSRLPSYLMELFRDAAYLLTYVGVNNMAVGEKLKKNRKYFLVTILFCISILVTGARMQLLKVSLFTVIVYFLLLKKSGSWNKQIRLSTLFKIIFFFILVLTAFVAVRSLVGRSTAEDPIYYLTSYAGGSIPLLELFVRDPVAPSEYWGKETFYAMYSFVARWAGIPELAFSSAKEFRSFNGYNLGNIYTALRCFYYDFGFAGCVLASGIVGFGFSGAYSHIRRKAMRPSINMDILMYAYLSYSICFFCINYYFDFLTPGFLKTIVFFYLMRGFLVGFPMVKFRLGGQSPGVVRRN